ncbi:MAG: MGMT family protein [Candidatus Nanoarchaeia archaeon]
MQKDIRKKLFLETSKIKIGELATYKSLAIKLNSSPRAVAKMLSKNKNPLIVPCHRVIKSNGELGGYTYKGKFNPKMKIRLLKKEGIRIKNNKVIDFHNIPAFLK